MIRPIPTEAYWELRARQLELKVSQEHLRMSSTMRQSIGLTAMVVQMLKGVDRVLADAQGDTKILGRALDAELIAAIERVGKSVGLTSDPSGWEIDLGTDPSSAHIQEKAEGLSERAEEE